MALLTGHYKGDTPTFSAEIRMQQHGGGYKWMLSRGQAVRDEKGRAIRMVGSQTDISEIKALQEKLHVEAIHDSMTGLYNRRHFEDRLAGIVATAIRHGRPLSVCICDIDDFKGINDRSGHPTGDRVLRSLALILRSETRAEDVAARYGGDEFCILFPEVGAAQAASCAERIRGLLERTAFVSDDGTAFNVTASFGLADIKDKNAAQFVGTADRELYEAKACGRNRLAIAQ
jgi:diguanylate cyclase (GGDEF)-like protein